MTRIWVSIAFALLLSGCASFERGVLVARSQVLASPEFAAMTLVDVVEAKKLASFTDDKLALRCWDHIEAFVRKNAPVSLDEAGKVVGPLSAYQKARNIRRVVIEVGIDDAFRIACSPMLTDSLGISLTSAIGRLGIRIIL
jgi:hypothetical protein